VERGQHKLRCILLLLLLLLLCGRASRHAATLVSKDMYKLMHYVGFVNWFAIAMAVAALLVFRKTRPDADRPVKVTIVTIESVCLYEIELLVRECRMNVSYVCFRWD
jgi:amino acid transporter